MGGSVTLHHPTESPSPYLFVCLILTFEPIYFELEWIISYDREHQF